MTRYLVVSYKLGDKYQQIKQLNIMNERQQYYVVNVHDRVKLIVKISLGLSIGRNLILGLGLA